jgi:hypothetical protein
MGGRTIKNLLVLTAGVGFGVFICLAVFPKILDLRGAQKNLAPSLSSTDTPAVAKTDSPSLPLPTAVAPIPTDCDIDVNDGGVSVLPILQLPDLIFRLLPGGGFQNLDWGYLSNQNYLLWKTSGINTPQTGDSCRQALARVKVGSVQSRFLLQKWTELPWTISLYSDENINFGPQWIDIRPGGPYGASSCFGVGFDGCTFDPDQVLKSTLFKVVLICSPSTLGGITDVFSITAPDKAPGLIIYNESDGSGGGSSWFEIRPLGYAAQVCKT